MSLYYLSVYLIILVAKYFLSNICVICITAALMSLLFVVGVLACGWKNQTQPPWISVDEMRK